MGVFMIAIIWAVLSTDALIIVSYIIDCIYTARVLRVSGVHAHLLAWVPVYNQYLFGKIVGCRWGGGLMSLIHLACASCFGLLLWLEEDVLFLGMICALTLVDFLMKLYLSDRLFSAAVPEKRWVLTLLTFVSLGWLRPVFFLALRKRLTTTGIWNLHKNQENNL